MWCDRAEHDWRLHARARHVAVAAPIVGVVGALIGTAIGSRRSKSLVYRAQN